MCEDGLLLGGLFLFLGDLCRTMVGEGQRQPERGDWPTLRPEPTPALDRLYSDSPINWPSKHLTTPFTNFRFVLILDNWLQVLPVDSLVSGCMLWISRTFLSLLNHLNFASHVPFSHPRRTPSPSPLSPTFLPKFFSQTPRKPVSLRRAHYPHYHTLKLEF